VWEIISYPGSIQTTKGEIMGTFLTALGIGAVVGFALGWKSHKAFVNTAISASRRLRRRAIGGRR
jgi:uncharacterized membrane protein (Fun14 family)